MNTDLNSLDVYRQLADWHERHGQASMRDRFLVLAADSAQHVGLSDEAEMLRMRLLETNPHHLLKPYRSFSEALQTPDVQVYIQDLRINYPLVVAEDLLHTLQANEETQAGVDSVEVKGPLTNDTTLPLDMPLRLEPENPGEGLKVYPLQREAAPQPPPKKTAPPARPTPAKGPTVVRPPTATSPKPVRRSPARATPAPPPTAALPRRTSGPAVPPRALHPEPDPFFSHAAAEEPDTEAPRGAWLTLMLLGIVCTAGIALAFYTFARPFWPIGWPPGFPSP